MKEINKQNKWEEKENTIQKNNNSQQKENVKCDIIGEIKKNSKEKPENGIIERKEKRGGHNRLNLIGQRFGRLMVLEDAGTRWERSLWKCLCDCGNLKIICAGHLKNGTTKSCGCLSIEKFIERNKKLRNLKGESGFNEIFRGYKSRAKRKNLEFILTKEEFSGLTQQNCFYCGTEPLNICTGSRQTNESREWSKYIYNGIDRKNNNGGYTIENCVSCCKKCNSAKNTMTMEEFKVHIKKINKHFIC